MINLKSSSNLKMDSDNWLYFTILREIQQLLLDKILLFGSLIVKPLGKQLNKLLSETIAKTEDV